MDTKELQQKSNADLVKYIRESRDSLRKSRFEGAGSGMRNTHAIRNMRKEIARALTELNRREQGDEVEKA